MKFLLDTNVVSELRKGERANRHVHSWFAGVERGSTAISVLTVGEIRRGIERMRRRDLDTARALERWLNILIAEHAGKILPIDAAIAEEWGRMNVPDPLPVVDSLLAATAKVHGLTLVTRNVGDVIRTGINVFNPFEG